MIKRFLSILTTVVLLIACSESNLVEKIDSTLSSNEINFSVLQVEASRAVETTTSSLCKNGNTISVTAIQHEGKWSGSTMQNSSMLMNNVDVVYNSGVWSYSPKAYWPAYSNEYVSFFSYYPATDDGYNGLNKSVNISQDGEMEFFLQRLGSNPIDQDVIYAIESNKSNSNNGNTISFNYKHLLSKLNFKISMLCDDQTSNVKITSIGLKNIKRAAIYQDYEGFVFMISEMQSDIDTDNVLLLSDSDIVISNGEIVTLESQLMLPQGLDYYSCAGNTPQIVLDYIVISTDGTETSESITYSLEDTFGAWEGGYSYNYKLNMNIVNSTISIDGTVGDFEDGGSAELNPENPEQTPVERGYVIPEGAMTYTVEVDAEGFVDVSFEHNIADLIAGCAPDAKIQMAYLDEDGVMAWQDWLVTDGWFGATGATYWGADDCMACIKPWTDGSFSYIGAFPGWEIGSEATVIFNYGNDVIVAITAKIVEPEPAPEFQTPEADYVYSAELEHNSTWMTCSWEMAFEDELTILAALGLDGDYNREGAMADAVAEGAVIIKGFNADGTLTQNVVNDHTGNSGYWFAEDGTVSTYGKATMVAEINSYYTGGTMCIKSDLTEAGKTYPGYYVYTANGKQVIIKLECVVTTPPPAPEFEVVGEYEFTLDVTYDANYANVANGFNIQTEMADIQDMIGGTPDVFQMSLADGTFQEWYMTDGWFGENGAEYWGRGALFDMKPMADGTFDSCCCMPDASAGTTAYCVFRYANSATLKAVDVKITVNISE